MDSSVKKGGAQPLSYTNTSITEPAALPGTPLLYSEGTLARPEINQKGGLGQPLSYTNTNITEPAALPGTPLLYSQGTIARPEINQKGGLGQPLSYTNTTVYEPAALAGAPLLYSQGTVARPEIGMRGGFHPSIMGNMVENARLLVPLAATAAYRLFDNRTRKRGGAKGDFETYRMVAKDDLERIAPGRANAKWIQKLAATRRRGQNNQALLEEFAKAKDLKNFDVGILKVPRKVIALPKSPEREEPTSPEAFVDPQSKWQYNRQKAKDELVAIYPKPSGINIVQYATLKRAGNEEAAQEFLEKFKAKAEAKIAEKAAKQAAKPPKKPVVPEVSRVTGRVVKLTEQAKLEMEPKSKAAIEKEAIVNTRPWPQIRDEAKEELNKIAKARIGNINKFAKLKKYGDTRKMATFLKEFKKKKEEEAALKKAKKPFTVAPAPADLPPIVVAEKPEDPAPKKKQVKFTPEQQNWEQYRSGAARMLEGIGGIGATAAEISELARKIKAKEDVRSFLDEYEQRVKNTMERKARLEREKAERDEQDRRDKERRQREHNESKWAEDEEDEQSAEVSEEAKPKAAEQQQREYKYEPIASTNTTPQVTPPLGWDYTPPQKRVVPPLPQAYRGTLMQPTAPLPPRPEIKKYGRDQQQAPAKVAIAPVQPDKYKAMIAELDRMIGKTK